MYIKIIIRLISLFFFLEGIAIGQQYIPADPFNILFIEEESFSDSTFFPNLIIRPFVNSNKSKNWSFLIRNEIYYNNNFPNFENMGNRFIGKGVGWFTSVNFSYTGNYLSFSIEPFYLTSQNKESMTNGRTGIFSRLNDVGYNLDSPYKSIGLRETQLYLHYNYIGIGYSNANMWWGPGIHNTLTMTNNSTGFPHILIGTLKEKRIRKIGVNARYVFSKLDKTIGSPYFTALVWSLRFFTDPLITVGLSRNYISGGIPTDRPFTETDAALIVFEQLLIDTKIKEYRPEWDEHDPWDQLMSGFLMVDFPLSKLRIYAEFGTNDHRQNFSDLRAHPDHASAYIIGLRKHGLFNIDNFLAGIEYSNMILGKFWKYRATPNWYDKEDYDYSSYDGRRWAAHSGSDSDDLYIYFSFNKNQWSFTPSFNFERHGVLYDRFPEVKMETRLDFRYIWNDYKFNIFYEIEWLEHAGFVQDEWRNSNVIWFGIQRDLSYLFLNKD